LINLYFHSSDETGDFDHELCTLFVFDMVNETDNDPLSLKSWGLPKEALDKYESIGITKLFQWQVDALTTGRALSGGNLIYSAPTSAGKTLVAELLMLKRVIETKKKAIMILPYVAVSREKVTSLSAVYGEVGLKVGGFMGSYSHSPPGGFASVDVAVCTIEKANSMINRLIEEKRTGEVSCVVIDEMHMVGDSSRGYLIELLLTKVKYMSQHFSNDSNQNPIQIIGMSATLPNLELLTRWLKADLYKTDFRPVPLVEMVKIGNTLYGQDRKPIRTLSLETGDKSDENNIFPLVFETIMNGHGVLIFCPTKKHCETMAESIGKKIYQINSNQTSMCDPSVSSNSGFVMLQCYF
jgi:DNA polymerase theta